MPETTPDDLIDAHAASIREAVLLDVAAGLDVRERVVPALDSRDPLGRDLAHLEPGGGQAFLDAHAATVARLEEEAATSPVMLFAPVDLSAVVRALEAAGEVEAVQTIEAHMSAEHWAQAMMVAEARHKGEVPPVTDHGVVVMVALGCVTVRGLSVYPTDHAAAA